jgi:hypothetical protein
MSPIDYAGLRLIIVSAASKAVEFCRVVVDADTALLHALLSSAMIVVSTPLGILSQVGMESHQ